MKNILSIDIDILFSDHLYFQSHMHNDLTPKQSWTIIKWYNELEKTNLNFDYDEKCLEKVLKIIFTKCKKAKVKSIKEHDEIIKVLEENDVKDSNVFNLDAHHDITYGSDDRELNIENWVLHGIKNGIIKDYTWICRPDSKCPTTPVYYGIKVLDTMDDEYINKMPEFDLVVICTSKHFTPPQHWNINKKLYDIVKENANEV